MNQRTEELKAEFMEQQKMQAEMIGTLQMFKQEADAERRELIRKVEDEKQRSVSEQTSEHRSIYEKEDVI